ncbi:LapA family protein [Nodularia harveyana UHCC-0300]|uniref:LapA family protein n=1 Tax=Nodularia harveyana UHCC-0300 TaxID=2974287 RepID=A0ABU5UDB7_9CYAN|nr:LapA family protein [Nodularia harveyana]MEA5580986.1 LapA family protein [Nodularia harveyana UHCC-0300]
MAVTRLILLVALLGMLTLLLVQNWSPVLSLVFLGTRTLPLPLAMWIFFSTAAGAATSLLITTLLKGSNYFGEQQQKPYKSTRTSPRTSATPREKFQPPPERPSPSPRRTESPTSKAFDDWDTDNSTNDDWDFDEQETEAPTPSNQTPPVRDSQTYERPQTPQSSSQSGSVYSYNYRQPENTAVGKTESVYDADYRVIIPPYQPPNNENEVDNFGDDEDDWNFFEDDDFEDEDSPKSK